jgi:predicted nucleic acid-binding protein
MGNKRLVAVVSDAGPLIHLSQIGKLHLIKQLFGKVLVNEEVKIEALDEGIKHGHPDAEAIAKAFADGWLRVEPAGEHLASAARKLAEGENISHADAVTLLLAVKNKAELLVDDKLVSDLGKMYGLGVWSTWTLLLEGLSREYLEMADVSGAIADLGKKKFRLNAKQAQEILDAAITIERHKRKS